MQTKDFTDPTEALAFIETLEADNSVDTIRLAGGIFRINWIKNKMFTSVDGKEYTDEVWTKEDGTMIVCQDLELEHARNIIRMMLRNDRSRRKETAEMMAAFEIGLQDAVVQIMDESASGDLPETAPVYH